MKTGKYTLLVFFCYDMNMKKPAFTLLVLLPLLLSFQISSFPIAPLTPTAYNLEYQTIRNLEGYRTAMPSVGDVNMLVIPISFSDASCSLIPLGCEETLKDIEQAFFADEEDIPWHSVASYYQQSSYGALNIEGVVSPWYTPTISAVELSNDRSQLNAQVILPALRWYKDNFPSEARTFDQDGDGFMDAVYFIYSLDFDPQDEKYGEDKDVFWAFVSYIGGQSNVLDPTLFHYGWSSFQFMYEDGTYQRSENGKVIFDENNELIFQPYKDDDGRLLVDAHVYIHEVGHLLGLVDYYSYQSRQGDWGPSGALDMMDYNVGDHNAYSKSVLDWTFPLVVQDSGVFTLSSFTETGQFIILTPQYNDTLMDEYIIIELSTPTGLNQKDAFSSYAGRYPRVFSMPGIKMYHIDSRVAEMAVIDGRFQLSQYTTSLQPNRNYRIAHSNTYNRGINPEFKLIHLLESSGINTFKHSGFATNQTLFTQGDTFNAGERTPFQFNSGQSFPFSIHIEALTATQATIRIQRL
jgi:M6 family metalloprotease-like protein